MKFSRTTEMMIQEGIKLIPLFIAIAIITYFGNKAFDHFGMQGLIMYSVVIIYSQLATINKNLRELRK